MWSLSIPAKVGVSFTMLETVGYDLHNACCAFTVVHV